MSILDGRKKINILVLLVICVVLALFLALGGLKMSRYTAKKQPLAIIMPNASLSRPAEGNRIGDRVTAVGVVGSKTGKKYHLPSCPGAKAIAEKNIVYFQDIEAAVRAGYEPAQNCKGLNTKKQ